MSLWSIPREIVLDRLDAIIAIAIAIIVIHEGGWGWSGMVEWQISEQQCRERLKLQRKTQKVLKRIKQPSSP
jgi:hypothetical protein